MSRNHSPQQLRNSYKDTLNVAVVTVCTPPFIRGTQTLISSFINSNPHFNGELVIIVDESMGLNKLLSRKFPNLKFHYVGSSLKKATVKVGQKNKLLKNKLAQFYSLEAFNLQGYDKVLFLDSDIVCKQSVQSLFNSNCELSACYDRAWHLGKHRLYDSFYMLDPKDATADSRTISPSYNSGVLLIDKTLIKTSVYEALIEKINTINWSDTSGVNDQIVINQYFEGKISPLAEKYNYITERGGFSKQSSMNKIDDACFIHFVGHPKPWNFKRIIKRFIKGNHLPRYWWIWAKEYWNYIKK